MAEKWFKIQDGGATQVAVVGDDLLPKKYVPGRGMVFDPTLNAYGRIGGGSDLGATEISKAEAGRLMAGK